MTSPTPLVISTQGLSKSYKGVNAVAELDLKVPANSIFGFLGPNGAGKSTTMRLLLGLIRPTRGSASIFGLDSQRDSIAIRRRVGYLAQDPRYYEHMSAREVLRFTARFFYSGPEDAIEERIRETLELVGLSDLADRKLAGFSGGERQRLGIAQAQINNPDLLVLDEPAAALDPMGRRDVLEVMERLRQRTTIFYSTHILDDVQRVSDVVAIMNRGRLVVQAPISELLADKGAANYQLTVKGEPRQARARLASEPWVSSIEVGPGERAGTSNWRVGVTDEAAAEAKLLRLVLADEQLTVLDFGRKRYNLEEVFMQLVEGGASR